MSIILRNIKTGEIKLYCKGADNILMSRLKLQSSLNDSLKLKTTQHLVEYANKGLRTLVVAKKVLNSEQYSDFEVFCKKKF